MSDLGDILVSISLILVSLGVPSTLVEGDIDMLEILLHTATPSVDLVLNPLVELVEFKSFIFSGLFV
jgi:hypothetical protein